jgi:hypothetical protein
MRVSLELAEAGTCVARVASKSDRALVLELLDEVPDGELGEGSMVDLFMPRSEGVYHWLCIVRSAPQDQRAQVELLDAPLLIQRRFAHRVGAALPAEVRREHAARRGRAHSALVADLSRGGLKLETAYQLTTGDTVEVTMNLSGATARLLGRVVMAYNSSPGRGGTYKAHVNFLEGQRQAIELVDRFITQQLSEASPEGF